MLFNSLEYPVFLAVIFFLYWFVTTGKTARNLLLVTAGYVFYGWWDWRFLSLILISTCVDFSVGLALGRTENKQKRRTLLALSLVTNLGILGTFKYYDFFADSFANLLTAAGLQVNPISLNVILPVGISFYTFQTLGYSIDVYRRKIEPTRDAPAFFAFVSFFPQLVAGPIERAGQLLPQFQQTHTFDAKTAREGLGLILWGLFKKVVIADTCAVVANFIFANHAAQGPLVLAVGAICFAFQIYGDFSGYSDIAIGSARLFGFKLMTNFRTPYFSRDPAEFWRRWHISLSTWFRDYVYIPLGGSRGRRERVILNVMATFTLSGLWHGANWTFVIWGFLNSLYYLPSLWQGKKKTGRTEETGKLPSLDALGDMAGTFALITLAWVFFRAPDLGTALAYLSGFFDFFIFTGLAQLNQMTGGSFYGLFVLIPFLLAVEWLHRDQEHPVPVDHFPTLLRRPVYYAMALAVFVLMEHQQAFIYFQF
ncbi:MAG: MBOAT family O-acyltransferase [Acidobacteriota bacterium]|nr:MBOAT family O-acyltransferase [Acidobacteriota bacterium]